MTPVPGARVVPVVDDDPEPTEIQERPPTLETGTHAAAPPEAVTERLRRRRWWVIAAAAVVVVAAGGIVAATAGGGGEEDAEVPAVAIVEGAARIPGPDPRTRPAPSPGPDPGPSPSPGPDPDERPSGSAQLDAPVIVSLTVKSEPPGAAIFTGEGEPRGTTPAILTAVKGSGPYDYVLKLRRHKERRIEWSAEENTVREVELRRVPDVRPVGGGAGGTVDPNATDNPFRKAKP